MPTWQKASTHLVCEILEGGKDLMSERRDHPERIWLEEEGPLVIEWADGHQTRLSAELLRRECPCAACREENRAGLRESGGPDGSGAPAPARPEEGVRRSAPRLRAVERVGRYALNVVWSDGHNTGIYPWSLLRDLCGCFACRMEKGES